MSSLPSTPVFVDTPVSSDPHTPDGHSPGILQSQQTATIDPYTGLAVLPPLPSHGAHPVVVAPPRVDSRASQHSPASRPDSLHTATVIVNDHLEQHLLDADGCLQSHRRRPDDALAIVERLGEEDHTTEDACVPNAVLDDYLNETLSPQNIRDHGPTAGPMRYAVTPPIARRTLYLLSVYDASVQEMLALENADAAALWRMDPDGNLVGRLQSAAALSEILATFTLTQSRLSSARAILTKRLQLHQGGALRRPRASRSPARRTSPLAPARAVTPIAPSRTASPAQPIPFPPPAASAPGFLSPRTSYGNPDFSLPGSAPPPPEQPARSSPVRPKLEAEDPRLTERPGDSLMFSATNARARSVPHAPSQVRERRLSHHAIFTGAGGAGDPGNNGSDGAADDPPRHLPRRSGNGNRNEPPPPPPPPPDAAAPSFTQGGRPPTIVVQASPQDFELRLDTRIPRDQIPEWDGSHRNIVHYLHRMINLARRNNDIATGLGRVAPQRFKGTALQWWDLLSEDNQKLFSSSWWELLEGIREQWMTPTFMSALALEFEGQRFRQPGHTHESPFDFFGRRLLYYRMTHQSTTPRGELYAIMKNAPPGWDTVLHVDGIQDTRFFLAKVADKSKELVNWTSVFEVEPEDDTWQSVVDLRTAPEAQRDYWAANPEVR